MLVTPRLFVSAVALLGLVGVACAPVERTYENVGGQGGQNPQGAGGDSGVSVAEATSSAAVTSSTASTGSGMCAAAEDCFNGVDDDCNGMTDCEDPACNPVAVCAPQLDGAPSGIVIPGTDACPSGYTAGDQVIYRKLVDGGCTGCACKPKGTACTGDVWYYPSALACTNDLALTGGTYAGNFGSACDSTPISGGQTYGMRTSAWKVQESCTVSGSPTLAPPAWGETMKFCKAEKEGKGCSAGSSCVPQTVAAPPHCALAAAGASCGTVATSKSDWYTGFNDTRVCGACGCTASGGSCAGVVLNVGSDYSCGANATVAQKAKKCFSGSGIYAPPVALGGIPTTGTCSADAAVKGSLDETGELTLCCQP
jgi:hypothetical protein